MSAPVRLALLTALAAAGLSGCSSFSKALNLEDSRWSAGNYREQERALAESLEVPPTLVTPQRNDSLSLFSGEGGVRLDDVKSLRQDVIPAFHAQGVQVRSTLCERWLAVEGVEADTLWQGVQRFLKTLGYPVKEANRATGIIRTEYVQRKEIVPLTDVSPLTRLLNKWRPEVAEGVLDRFTVHVTVDESGQAQVRFHHHQVFAQDDGDIERYRVRPYDPVKELEMLYQAAIFFGAHKQAALKQVEVSAHTVEIVEGTEVDGLVLHAPMAEAWAYVQSMAWRADWQVVEVRPELHQMVVSLEATDEKGGFWSSLAFWRRNELPGQVILTLRPLKEQPDRTLLQLDVPEGQTPLDEQTRIRLFKRLGLLAQ